MGPGHEGMTISTNVRGGGVVAGWRITGMLQRQGEGKALPNALEEGGIEQMSGDC